MTETLWIMRHGLAASQFDTDFNRPLSDTGREQARLTASQILADGLLPERILVSPFRRTQETCDEVISTLAFAGERETDDMFTHFADHELAASYLAAQDNQKIMVISHMPIVARMSLYLDPGCGIGGYQTAQAVRFMRQGNRLVADKNYLPN